jgi:hypothetical protein
VSALTQYLPGPTSEASESTAPSAPDPPVSQVLAPGLIPDTIRVIAGDDLTIEQLDVQPPELISPDTPPGSEIEADDDIPEDEDLFTESPTLTRLDAADVDLDMDDDWLLDADSVSGSDYDSQKEADFHQGNPPQKIWNIFTQNVRKYVQF